MTSAKIIALEVPAPCPLTVTPSGVAMVLGHRRRPC
jgi:hypothetical protein